jgi:HSP20 family molecular chaperone IbpA
MLSPLSRRPDNGLTATRSQLFTPFEDVFDRFFDDFFGDRRNLDRAKAGTGYPKLDIVTEESSEKQGTSYWVVKAAVPGVNPDELKVEVLPQTNTAPAMLRISGQMSEEYRSPDHAAYHMRELHKSSFRRELVLPDYIEGDPQAKIKDGILTLRWLQKYAAQAKPKVIDVKREDEE